MFPSFFFNCRVPLSGPVLFAPAHGRRILTGITNEIQSLVLTDYKRNLFLSKENFSQPARKTFAHGQWFSTAAKGGACKNKWRGK